MKWDRTISRRYCGALHLRDSFSNLILQIFRGSAAWKNEKGWIPLAKDIAVRCTLGIRNPI
jgi:hypothetical protein